MSRLARTVGVRQRRYTIVPFALAAIVAVLSALLYLELVTALLEYVG